MKKVKQALIAISAAVYGVFLIVYAEKTAESVHNSVMLCLTVLIPSLFSFMVISDFILATNLYKLFGKPFGIISRYVFRIPEELFSIFLLSQLAGYPVGARLISKLASDGKIDTTTAADMMGYCYMAGPAFICGIAGVSLFGSVRAGMVIFGIILFSNILTAFIIGLSREIPKKSKTAYNLEVDLSKLVSSVNSGAKGMLSVCIMVIFFSSVSCILNELGVIPYFAVALSKYSNIKYSDCLAVVQTIIEVSRIKEISGGNIGMLPLAAGLLSFGGFCVILQVNGFVLNKFSLKNFYICRIISPVISYYCGKIAVSLFDDYIFTFKMINDSISIGYRQISPIPSVFLLIMTILLLSKNSIAKSKKI